MAYFIIGNYGNDTVALMEWAYQHKLTAVSVVSVDTGFSASDWQERVDAGLVLTARYGFTAERIASLKSFSELVQERGYFPSSEFHYCPLALKGLAILKLLDIKDPHCEATIVLPSRRLEAHKMENLAEFHEKHTAYEGRRVWYPLYKHTLEERDALIAKSGLALLPHRSLECNPCIYNTRFDFHTMSTTDLEKTAMLEAALNQPFFKGSSSIVSQVASSASALETEKQGANFSRDRYNSACGSDYGCGY